MRNNPCRPFLSLRKTWPKGSRNTTSSWTLFGQNTFSHCCCAAVLNQFGHLYLSNSFSAKSTSEASTSQETTKSSRASKDKLRQREMQGRSASMMCQDIRLPWGNTMLSPQSPEAQQFIRVAREQDWSVKSIELATICLECRILRSGQAQVF